MALSPPILVIIYMLALLFGAVVVTLLLVFFHKDKSQMSKSVLALSVSVLLYCIFEFFGYSLMDRFGQAFIKIYTLLSDFCYFLFVCSWLYFLILLRKPEKPLSLKVLALIIGIYGLAAESIVIIWLEYDWQRDVYIIASEGGRLFLMVMNFVFALAVLFVSFGCSLYGQTKMEHGRRRNALRIFGVLLALYMVWTLIWDYEMIDEFGNSVELFFFLDPLLLIYVVFNLAVICFFFKKSTLLMDFGDPSENKDIPSSEEAFSSIAARFGLTQREAQVMQLACLGKSNPEIGAELFIAENTVKRHLNNIFRKAEIKNRYELLSLVNNEKRSS